MEEAYDGSYIIDSIKEYVAKREEGIFDGFEVVFPQGMNTLDPLLMIRYGTLEATFEEQLLLTKSSIVGKPVKIKFFGEEVGSFQMNDISAGFLGFSVFEQYPMALQMLIRVCYMSVLKNLIPPLSASQLATMKALRAPRENPGDSSEKDRESGL